MTIAPESESGHLSRITRIVLLCTRNEQDMGDFDGRCKSNASRHLQLSLPREPSFITHDPGDSQRCLAKAIELILAGLRAEIVISRNDFAGYLWLPVRSENRVV